MLKFSWKKSAAVKRSHIKVFSGSDTENDKDETLEPPSKKVLLLEDKKSKSERLKREGIILAEAKRYWEAVKYWDEALSLVPNDARIHEMKAQVFMELHEVFPAVQSASRAVEHNPLWWEAYQTLGRAQLGLGDIALARRSFSTALHLNPSNIELRKDDLMWSVHLANKAHDLARNDELEKEMPSVGGHECQEKGLEVIGNSELQERRFQRCEIKSDNALLSDNKIFLFEDDRTKSEMSDKIDSSPAAMVRMRY